ncbi:O-antigen ligase family protein [Clostridium sp. DL-VIII]|uniref:O-antigen ligase family protein n=1 Tax=Clostridium sp. DL-VIII TaxID=641107 RepID=UPI00117EC679|nr:O-antigen ligase family protein [Clostridium sp. DL-VIII]
MKFNFFIPIALILTIIPLIVHVASVRIDDETIEIYARALQSDLFSQWKASILLFFSIILVIFGILFFKRIFEKKDKVTNLILIGSIIFWIFTLCSAIFSVHKAYAIHGAFDRAEGFITITCYIILLIYSIYTFRTAKNLKYVIVPILILVAIEAFLGVFQYTGNDLINSTLGLFLVTGKTTGKLSLMYETGKLYGTLYHYNYVGSFVAIVLPILVVLAIFVKKTIYKILLGIGALLSLWLLFGSTSRAGIIGIGFSALLGIIILWKSIFKRWKIIAICIAALVVLVVGLNLATNGTIFIRTSSLISDSLSFFKDTSDFNYQEHTPVKDVKNIDNHSEIIFPKETLKLSYENNKLTFRNSKNELVNYIQKNNVFTTDNAAFKNTSFEFERAKTDTAVAFIYMKINNDYTFAFRLGKDNSIHLIDINNNNDIDIDYPETISLFNGKEKLGSSRGYIWSRSIPLIKNNIVIGGGPDSYIYQFPKNDLIGKYYAYDTPNMIVDKPHNLYLQIALNEGLIALLAFLAIMIIYIVDSIKLYALKKEYNESQILGIAICLGVVGYLFAGLFNDSVISVAPIFWIILGVGVSINYTNRQTFK